MCRISKGNLDIPGTVLLFCYRSPFPTDLVTYNACLIHSAGLYSMSIQVWDYICNIYKKMHVFLSWAILQGLLTMLTVTRQEIETRMGHIFKACVSHLAALAPWGPRWCCHSEAACKSWAVIGECTAHISLSHVLSHCSLNKGKRKRKQHQQWLHIGCGECPASLEWQSEQEWLRPDRQ